MSGSNHCFLTWIQVSQEEGKMVWYSHLFKNFPPKKKKEFFTVYCDPVKGFSIVNEAVDICLEFPSILYDPTNVGNLISSSSVFSKPSLYTWNFLIHVQLKSNLKYVEHYLASMWNVHNCAVVWTFFGTGMKTDLSQSCGHCWVFQIYWHIECSTFSSVQSLSCIQIFATPRTAVCQASLSITNSQSLLKLMSIESVMSCNHLTLTASFLWFEIAQLELHHLH